MDRAVLRRLALESLLAAPATDFQRLQNAVAALAAERGVIGPERTVGPGLVSFSEPKLSNSDETILQEVVWDLIVERVLTPGLDAMNPEWPWLRMTDRGRRMANGEIG